MNPPDAFNFGRRIKDLKRTYNKTYAELTSGLKISRERIIQLEENEREPTDIERRRFAEFYAVPPEELGAFGGGNPAPRPYGTPPGGERIPYQPQPSYDNRPNYGPPGNNYGNSNYGPPPGERGNYNPAPVERGNYGPPQGMDRRGGYEPRGGNYDGPPSGNYGDRPPRGPGNFNDRPPRGPGNFNDRPPRPGGGGNFGARPGRGPEDGERPARPAKPPKPKAESKSSGEPKPVMKYTAEQLGDIESAYLRKQRDLKVPLKFTFLSGQEFTGVVVDFTPFTVHIIDQTSGEEVILRKLAMAYYRKADALEEAKSMASGSDEG